MAVQDLAANPTTTPQAPQYVKPNISHLDRFKQFLGNSESTDNKRNQAAFENAINVSKYQYDLYKDSLLNSDSRRKQSLLKAGINPLVAYSQGVGGASTYSGSTQSTHPMYSKRSNIRPIQDIIDEFKQDWKDVAQIMSSMLDSIIPG